MVGVGLEEGAIHMRRPNIILGFRDALPHAVVDVEFHRTTFHTAVHVRLLHRRPMWMFPKTERMDAASDMQGRSRDT